MPVSKRRKHRSRFHHTAVPGMPPAADRNAVIERAYKIRALRPNMFDDATPREVGAYLFDGWNLVGERAGVDLGRGTLLTHVWNTGDQWLGFCVAYGPAPEPPPSDTMAVHDYITLMASGKSGYAAWEALDGKARLDRTIDGLEAASIPIGRRRPDRTRTAVETDAGPASFVNAVQAATQRCLPGDNIRHLIDMVDVMMTETIDDPDGSLAATRTLVALGGYHAQLR